MVCSLVYNYGNRNVSVMVFVPITQMMAVVSGAGLCAMASLIAPQKKTKVN